MKLIANTIAALTFLILFLPPASADAQRLADSALLYSYPAESNNYSFYGAHNFAPLEFKSVGTARWYSIGITVGALIIGGALSPAADEEGSETLATIGGIISLGGFIIGPSAGSIYADDWSRATRGMMIRGGSVVFVTAGALALVVGTFGGGEGTAAAGVLMMGAGLAVGTVSMVYDAFRSSQKSVEEYNRKVHERTSFHISPWIDIDTGAPGLSASVRF